MTREEGLAVIEAALAKLSADVLKLEAARKGIADRETESPGMQAFIRALRNLDRALTKSAARSRSAELTARLKVLEAELDALKRAGS